jgi:hypothetical protein
VHQLPVVRHDVRRFEHPRVAVQHRVHVVQILEVIAR